ncbi:MAG TPA: GNAT family N-acetyltransferase [Polyangia bacterium]
MQTTGPGFSEEHALRDGSRVRLRHIRPEDADELKRGMERLSPASRYSRFLGSVGQLSEGLIHYLTNVDGQDHVAIVATRPRADGGEEGLGVTRFVRVHGEPTVAEPAITVLDDEQHKGIGHLLALTLARAAHERGISHFRGEILANNDAIRELLSNVGAELRATEDGRVVFDVGLEGAPPTDEGPHPARSLLAAASTWLAGLFRAH